ncbi:MAG: type I pullulanase [Lachnospiraceae bacterium]|nr:type I pullulanase [Lachnospiraceae bacterium]
MRENTIYLEKEFEEKYTYTGKDLGCNYSKERVYFRVYAPTAESVILNLYKDGLEGEAFEQKEMKKDQQGTYVAELTGDFHGVYYTYTAEISGKKQESVDPYARAVGANGKRGMIVDLSLTNPEGFTTEKRPQKVHPVDAVLYELHVRDFSMDDSSGMDYQGKFLAFTQEKTINEDGLYTGVAHLKELGVTHVHILPAFDYGSVDETKLHIPQYNWGYDPMNYNVPEGSYSTDPFHGEVRIREFKKMVQALHKQGICVVMDVVYNHVFDAELFCYQKLVPDYFFRKDENDQFTDASACGNETASNHLMVRKYMVDSLCYWAEEYHIDGFRFDLMAVHDITTMNEIRKALNEIDEDILLYGEGWTADDSPLPKEERALKKYTYRMPGIASFSDDLRDAIKGSVFEEEEKGFVSGEPGLEDMIKFGVTGAVGHSSLFQLKNSKEETVVPWAKEPSQCVNYTSCHDNYTLWDKLVISNPECDKEEIKEMNKLAAAIVFTSQGIPFLHAGEELLRSKPDKTMEYGYRDNSYNSSDEINSIKWSTKKENLDMFRYYQGLIAFRKSNSALRLRSKEQIEEAIIFRDKEPGLVAYEIKTKEEELFVIYNGSNRERQITLPAGEFEVYINKDKAGTTALSKESGQVTVAKVSAMVLKKCV